MVFQATPWCSVTLVTCQGLDWFDSPEIQHTIQQYTTHSKVSSKHFQIPSACGMWNLGSFRMRCDCEENERIKLGTALLATCAKLRSLKRRFCWSCTCLSQQRWWRPSLYCCCHPLCRGPSDDFALFGLFKLAPVSEAYANAANRSRQRWHCNSGHNQLNSGGCGFVYCFSLYPTWSGVHM